MATPSRYLLLPWRRPLSTADYHGDALVIPPVTMEIPSTPVTMAMPSRYLLLPWRRPLSTADYHGDALVRPPVTMETPLVYLLLPKRHSIPTVAMETPSVDRRLPWRHPLSSVGYRGDTLYLPPVTMETVYTYNSITVYLTII